MPEKSRHCCIRKRWIVLSIVLGLAAVVGFSFAIFKEVYTPDPPFYQRRGGTRQNTLLDQYQSFFREVPQAGLTVNDVVSEPYEVPETDTTGNDTCSLQCASRPSLTSSLDEPRVGRLADFDVKSKSRRTFHGCCESYQDYSAPPTLYTPSNKRVKLVQFKTRKQFFLQDVCRHVQGCQRGCRCKQQNITTVAVVVDDDGQYGDYPSEEDQLVYRRARLEFVTYPGWCKCFNSS
ncbi:uncharacterized protein LOC131942866 [Physella acuta]|uniref:uncharacterized protein LOC131942866 n=1 Tax=Physella acuta TaxID=109671 RepID=UPI0027DB0898|nr:uncharacterized protein LOC131942866 [Physella acuta]